MNFNLMHMGVAAVVGGALGWFAKWLHGATKLRANELKISGKTTLNQAQIDAANRLKDSQIDAQAGRINLPK